MQITNLTTAINGEIVTASFVSGNCSVKVQFNVCNLPDFTSGTFHSTVLQYLTENLKN